MMGTDTEVVRREADRWSLAGDRQLLSILKTMHEKVVTRATHLDATVQEMMSSVRRAGVALENVNNRLASLSSNQFIESRVYDDDGDTHAQNPPSKIEKCEPSPTEGLLVLQRFYEELEILPDTSDSDDDEDPPISNVVLRAKDLYADRPLPAIIGSAAWKTKWHAGLLEEDSDSDSSVCKRDSNVDQYSSSDEGGDLQESLPVNREHHESFTSEDIPVSDEESSSRAAAAGAHSKVGLPDDHYGIQSQGPPDTIHQSQSDFAAELARRLGGHVTHTGSAGTVGQPTVDVKRPHAARHMFSDQLDKHRVTGNVFPDEPPPLDAGSDDGMFDVQRPTHKHHDIFDDDDDDDDIFDDFADSKVSHDEPAPKPTEIDLPSVIKKPVGGKSLFGSQKGSESIGAAIRKRRESTSSDDEVQHPQDSTTHKTVGGHKTEVHDDKTDIFDDLFAKSEQENKKSELKDDIFDDIDDIFSTEIVSKAPIKEVTTTKNIFDDHDDLFADIDVDFDFKTRHGNQKVVDAPAKNTPDVSTGSSNVAKSEKFKNIFGDDDDDDNNDGLFSNLAKSKYIKDTLKGKSLFSGSDEDLFNDDKDFTNSTNVINSVKESQEKMQQGFEIQPNAKNDITENSITVTKSNIYDENKLYDKSNELKQEIVNSDLNTRENLEEDHNVKKENIDEVAIPKLAKAKNEEINISSQDCTQEDMLSNKECSEEKLDNSLHQTNLNNKQNNFCDAEKNIDELFRNSVNNDTASFSVTNDFHDIFNDIPPAVEKIRDIKKSSNKNALFDKDDDDDDDDDDKNKDVSSTANNDFHDIIFNDQPPAFEKSKDIKKSKNINALFDDDSDDESLFFKKNDTLEENPEVFLTKNDSDRIFGLFNDEPPAVISDEGDIFSDTHFIEKSSGEVTSGLPSEKDQPDVKVPAKVEIIGRLQKENVAANTDTIIEKSDEKDVFIDTDARKSVGKIKSNININVATLLPGASPKKIVKPPELNNTVDRSNEKSELDGGVFTSLETSPKMKQYPGTLVKSASFDVNPESPVLCNKVSKERAKIQVRRRPSTRRARREAIRRSDTDLAKVTDATDGPARTTISTLGNVYTDIQRQQDDRQLENSDSDSEFSTGTRENREPQYLPKCEPDKGTPEVQPQTTKKDVFQNNAEAAVSPPNNPDKRQLVIEDSDDGDDIFKTFAHNTVSVEQKSTTIQVKKTIQTKTPVDTAKVDTAKQKSLFGDDSSDEELFGGNNGKNKKSGSAKSSATLVTKKPPVTQNKSLFGDDSDEDIFTSKTKVKVHSQPTKRDDKSVSVSSSLPVSEDPLSMFHSSQ